MKSVLLYASTHGKTRKVVAEALKHLAVQPDVFDVKELQESRRLAGYDLLLVFCPTYGDEELQDDMEHFLRKFDLDLRGKHFVICELGNYYGYDDFSFGALRLIRAHLLELGAQELCGPLSLDTIPRTNWNHLNRWVELVNTHLHASHGR